MAYEKQNWKTGDTITAEKLNHIEDGIGGSSSTNLYEIEVEEIIGEQGVQHIISQDTIDYIVENEPLFIYGSKVYTFEEEGEEEEVLERKFKIVECYCFTQHMSPLDSELRAVTYLPITNGSSSELMFYSKEVVLQGDVGNYRFHFLEEDFEYNRENDYWISADVK